MRIAVHAFDGMTMFHLAVPLLVFGEVRRLDLAAGWQVQVWTDDGAPIRTSEGLVVADTAGPAAPEAADLLVLPSWPVALPEPEQAFLDGIRHAHARGAGIAGLCLGAFPVVASGLLDGRSAVTHWTAAEQLAARYPQVRVQAAALYLDHGDVLTSAGTASGLDACLHLVRARLGAEAAAVLARQIVIAPHREGGQAQYIDRPVHRLGRDDLLGPTIEWALANLDRPLSVADLAARARMSTRSFTRHFQQTTGTSPARWVLARRLDEARRLLETTDRSIAQVAALCGFASPVTFRQNFVAAYATTPSSYRKRFAEPAG